MINRPRSSNPYRGLNINTSNPYRLRILTLEAQIRALVGEVREKKAVLEFNRHWVGLDSDIAAVHQNYAQYLDDLKNGRNVVHFPFGRYVKALQEYNSAYKLYWGLKTVLASLRFEVEKKNIARTVSKAENRLKIKFDPLVNPLINNAIEDGGFNLDRHPKIKQEMDKTIDDAITDLKSAPSQGKVASVLVTLAGAQSIGYSGDEKKISEGIEEAVKALEKMLDKTKELSKKANVNTNSTAHTNNDFGSLNKKVTELKVLLQLLGE